MVEDELYADGVCFAAWLHSERKDGTYIGRGFVLRESDRIAYMFRSRTQMVGKSYEYQAI